MTGPRAEDSRATAAYFPKGSFLLLAYSQVPRTMGQVLTGFFPNRENPAHQSYHHQREAVGRFPRAAQDQHREGGDYRGVDQGCPHAGQPDIVSDEGVLRHHDADQAPCNIVRGIQQRARQEKPGGKDQQHDIQGLVPHVACIL